MDLQRIRYISPTRKYIPQSEKTCASMYLEIKQLGLLSEIYSLMENERITISNLMVAWRKVEELINEKTGFSPDIERLDWLRNINAGDHYCFEEWEYFRDNFVLLESNLTLINTSN